MQQTINKLRSNLYFIGALVGLSAFLAEQIVMRVVPLDIYLSLLTVSGVMAKYVVQLIALVPVAFVWRAIFRRMKLRRPGYSALAAVWVTDIFVTLFTMPLRGWTAGWPTHLLFYIGVGTLITPLTVRIYERVKNDAYAGYVAIIFLVVLLVGAEFLTSYITSNSRLFFGN